MSDLHPSKHARESDADRASSAAGSVRLVLVSDASRAMLYVLDERGTLRASSALVRAPGGEGAPPAGPAAPDADGGFAARICQELDERERHGQRHRIILAADPPFLGELREHLSERVRQDVDLYIDEDLTELSPEELGSAIEAKLRQL
jgi:hypothetical protein